MTPPRPTQDAGPPLAFIRDHLIGGTLGALVLGLVLLYADVGGLKQLMWDSPDRWLYLVLYFFGLWITCGSVALAVGIMRLGDHRDPPAGDPQR